MNSCLLPCDCVFTVHMGLGVAAALGLKAVLMANPSVSGTITVLGTPAEEGGGGKIDLIDGGALSGLDVCMMVHPEQTNMMAPITLAVNHAEVVFTGLASHASASPWDGVNALDAAVSAYNGLSMLRQQMKPTCRLHAVISEGGVKPNIIPERTVLKFYVRAVSDVDLAVLKEKASNIMQSAALATGCSVELKYATEQAASYSNVVSNTKLVELYRKHWLANGPVNPSISDDRVWASTDMGNISYVVPAIHPTFSIGTEANIHTRDFTASAMKPEAHAATLCCSKAMSAIGWDLLTNAELLKEVKQIFKDQMASYGK